MAWHLSPKDIEMVKEIFKNENYCTERQKRLLRQIAVKDDQEDPGPREAPFIVK